MKPWVCALVTVVLEDPVMFAVLLWLVLEAVLPETEPVADVALPRVVSPLDDVGPPVADRAGRFVEAALEVALRGCCVDDEALVDGVVVPVVAEELVVGLALVASLLLVAWASAVPVAIATSDDRMKAGASVRMECSFRGGESGTLFCLGEGLRLAVPPRDRREMRRSALRDRGNGRAVRIAGWKRPARSHGSGSRS
jgi:hypothetical protein